MFCRNAARATLILVLAASPWWFGGVTPTSQLWIYAGVTLAALWWVIDILIRAFGPDRDREFPVPVVLIPAALLLLCGAVQLLPIAGGDRQLQHAQLWDWLTANPLASAEPGPLTVCPAATRLELMRLFFALTTMILAVDLFRDPGSQLFLLRAVAWNGLLLGGFGIVQKLSWNGRLFWTVPLTRGGEPFASFVNRNNASGYLNLCFACGVGLLLSTYGSRLGQGEESHHIAGLRRERALICLLIIAVAVLFANSRGGTVALVLMGCVASFQFVSERHRKPLLGGMLAVAAGALTLLIWIGSGETVLDRLLTLGELDAADGRINHWSDSLHVLADAPLFGLGLGTYHFAHKPYQSHLSSVWYYNADSEYVEWLVETGALGGLLGALFIVALILLARRLIARPRSRPTRVVGTVLLLVIVSQTVLAVGDFGISLPASQLLAAAICGMAAGTGLLRHKPGAGSPQGRNRIAEIARPALGLFILITAAAALHQLYWAARTDQFRRSLPPLTGPDDLTDSQSEFTLSQAALLLARQPDHPELNHDVARIHLFRFRQLVTASLLDAAGNPDADAEQLWQHSHPNRLYLAATVLLGRGEQAPLRELIPGEGIESLDGAIVHAERAGRACPLMPGVAELFGCLLPLRDGTQSSESFRREVFISPSDPVVLNRIGLLMSLSGAPDLAARCWNRLLTLDPQSYRNIFPIAIEALGEQAVLEGVIPSDSVALFTAFAESTDALRREALARAEHLLSGRSDPESDQFRGRIAELGGDLDTAIRHYRRAALRLPLNIDWRLRLARALEWNGQVEDAVAELQSCKRIAPQHPEVSAMLERLTRMPPD